MSPESIAEIRNALQIIQGYAETINELSIEGFSLRGASVIKAQVGRIVKILEAEHANEHD